MIYRPEQYRCVWSPFTFNAQKDILYRGTLASAYVHILMYMCHLFILAITPELPMLQHMFICILLPPFHTGSCLLRGFRLPYTHTTDQTNTAIFISAEGNRCKGTDPAENRALIAAHLKPNVIATDKCHPKVHR